MEAGPMPDSGFPFFLCPRICCTHCGDGSVFFCSRRIAPLPELRPSLAGKQGVRGSFFLFSANRSAPGTAPRRWPEKQGVREPFFVPGESLRSRNCARRLSENRECGVRFFVPGESLRFRNCAPSLAGKTGGAGAVFCFRRIVFVPKHRPADGRSAGLRRNSPNSPKWFAFRAESIRKTLSDCLEPRCGEGVCYEIVKYI